MIRLLMSIFLSVLPLAYGQVGPKPPAIEAFEQNRQLGRGMNILGSDPVWHSRDQARFQPKHFQLLKEAGFNSVRINLHPFALMSPTNKWRLPDSWIQSLNWVLVNANKQGLTTILDLDESSAMAEDPAANETKFLEFWRQIALRYRNSPSSVLFELLGEPSGKLTPQLWNDYASSALALIRERSPSRTVILGPAFGGSISHLAELNLPADDTNLIVTVHYFEPKDFTRQAEPGTKQADKAGVEWMGTSSEREAIERDFGRAAAWAKEHHRPIFLGAFGADAKAPLESRARYAAAVARAAEQRGWSWAYWQFEGDFGLFNMQSSAWAEPIRDALVRPIAKASQ